MSMNNFTFRYGHMSCYPTEMRQTEICCYRVCFIQATCILYYVKRAKWISDVTKDVNSWSMNANKQGISAKAPPYTHVWVHSLTQTPAKVTYEEATEQTREWNLRKEFSGCKARGCRGEFYLSPFEFCLHSHVFACLSVCVGLHISVDKSAMFALLACSTAVSQLKPYPVWPFSCTEH